MAEITSKSKSRAPTDFFFNDLAPGLGDLESRFRLNNFWKYETQRMVDSLFVTSMNREGKWSDSNKESTLQRFNWSIRPFKPVLLLKQTKRFGTAIPSVE
ncbi:unnamed protein product [Brassica rapa subsp. narinosa]